MERFTSAIRKAVQDGNFFAALFVSLAMPDICGALEAPQSRVGDRYNAWFQRYLRAKYDPTSHLEFLSATMPHAVSMLPPEAIAEMQAPFDKTLSFSADDCYTCRCKCLHQGILEKSGKEKFVFITPLPNGAILHRNLRNGKLVLQIDVFAEDVCLAVEDWQNSIRSDAVISARMNELMTFTEWFNL